jgi:hypothetical protein
MMNNVGDETKQTGKVECRVAADAYIGKWSQHKHWACAMGSLVFGW